MDIRDLGNFDSIQAVWAQYPEGGIEGDYLFIEGVKYRWNKYALLWENALTVTETPARQNTSFDGDVTVMNNLTVVGTLHAKKIGFDEYLLGLFPSVESLMEARPEPPVGAYAYIGTAFPMAVYRFDGTDWVDSGAEYSGENADITDYAHGVVDDYVETLGLITYEEI